jgi:hypothetical protein
MKKLLVSLALASSAFVAAAPASAQYYGDRDDRYQDRYNRGDEDRYDRGYGDRRDDRYGGEHFTRNNWLGQRLDRINYAIRRGTERGVIDPREEQRLSYEHQQLWRIAQSYYASNGLNPRERDDLERRLDRLEQRLQYARNDDRRYRRY